MLVSPRHRELQKQIVSGAIPVDCAFVNASVVSLQHMKNFRDLMQAMKRFVPCEAHLCKHSSANTWQAGGGWSAIYLDHVHVLTSCNDKT